ncbi:MAG: hypothetical protein BZY79_02495 [SAR202 cluster bacterium Casp-Chloro-G4]|nr:polyprenyl synthetase family protein [Chloroflexota bacterium]MDA1227995.1 polyprenyl synthetase family protein [Chloroflexota bacterium]PKB61700.1 MAG: hypothetical protein BZY79_02495 [SAR202 cluster bacterium Casp-Chloro-G4]
MTKPLLNTPDKQTDSLPGLFLRYRAEIGTALRQAITPQNSSKEAIAVYDMLRYYMGWADTEGNPIVATEGKYLRPTLCLFACQATGGSIEQAMPAAVALELIHNFSLIHDDIQDQDETRHHRKTLWAVWGIPKALVAGNVLRVVADFSLEELIRRGVDAETALGVASLLTEAYLEMIEGQYLDLSFEGQSDLGMQDYLGMIARKTGALIRCAFTMGALIGSGDKATANAFRSSGEALGFIFQVRDDVLGVWGDEKTTGKPVGADIRRKKNSFPVVHAMSQAKGAEKQSLLDIYRQDEVAEGDVGRVLEIMDRAETRGCAHEMAMEHGQDASDALESVELEPSARAEIEELIQFLVVREH